jgi:hypothetical protein
VIEAFPRLAAEGYLTTSPVDPSYNCIAWAAGSSSQWWQPIAVAPYFWPLGLPRGDYSIANYVDAFRSIGYELCADGELEGGSEKIVLYGGRDQGSCTHAARQLNDGRWASKLGPDIDIEHQAADSLTGPLYGRVEVYMSRERTI